jgi:hypothetical protein
MTALVTDEMLEADERSPGASRSAATSSRRVLRAPTACYWARPVVATDPGALREYHRSTDRNLRRDR